jgi:putative ABC transport system substrate-binding protein
LINEARVLAIYSFAENVRLGGLIADSFVDPIDFAVQAARWIDRILGGAKASELPFYQATTFKLIINLKTAKTSASRYRHLSSPAPTR